MRQLFVSLAALAIISAGMVGPVQAVTVFTASDAAGFANANAAFAAWSAAVGGSFSAENLESVSPADPLASFSVNGHTFSAGNAFGLSVRDIAVSGMVPHSGDTYLFGGSFVNRGVSPVIWDLPVPAKAFGFFASDIELGDVTVTFACDGLRSFSVSGVNAFWGIADVPHFVQTVMITPGNPADVVGYDDFVVVQQVPEPSCICLLAAGMAALTAAKWTRKRDWVQCGTP